MIDVRRYRIAGINVADLTRKELGEALSGAVLEGRKCIAFSMNGEGVAYYHHDPKFRVLIDQADIVHADGWSTMMAGRLFTSGRFSGRVATTDAYIDMLEACQRLQVPVYFLGGKDSIISVAVDNIKKQFPSLIVAGFEHGYFKEDNVDLVFSRINASKAQVVFVGLGRPKQEEFSLRLRDACPNLMWIKTCGGVV